MKDLQKCLEEETRFVPLEKAYNKLNILESFGNHSYDSSNLFEQLDDDPVASRTKNNESHIDGVIKDPVYFSFEQPLGVSQVKQNKPDTYHQQSFDKRLNSPREELFKH